MTETQFILATALGMSAARKWYAPVEEAMMEFAIVSPERAAGFIATIGHESGGFLFVREIWGPTAAQRRYDIRSDLGNTLPEAIEIAAAHGSTPGSWWRGYGLIQTTGYNNMKATGEALGLDLLNEPALLQEPRNAARSAGWWWAENGCNEIMDHQGFLAVSRRVNLGSANSSVIPNGWPDREKRYVAALSVFK